MVSKPSFSAARCAIMSIPRARPEQIIGLYGRKQGMSSSQKAFPWGGVLSSSYETDDFAIFKFSGALIK